MCKQSYFPFCLQLIQSSVAVADAARHAACIHKRTHSVFNSLFHQYHNRPQCKPKCGKNSDFVLTH